jgi:hypothetical protein
MRSKFGTWNRDDGGYMAKFHLEIDERERGVLMFALGAISGVHAESYPLAARIAGLAASGQSAKPPVPSGMPVPVNAAAPVVPCSPEPAVEPGFPEAGRAGELVITPVKVEQSADGKAMVVTYRIRTANSTRTTTIRCWDPKLFSALLATAGQPTTFLVKESKGFTNIVGVKTV